MMRLLSTIDRMLPFAAAAAACPRADRYRNAQAWYAQISVVLGSKPEFMFAGTTHLFRRLQEPSP